MNGYQKYQICQNLFPPKLPAIQYVIAYFCHFSPSLTITNLFYSFSPSVFNDGQWSVGPVLDSFNISLLYEQILKERRKELNEYMTDKEKELQVINESLHHDLQVSRINYQSLQEALLESGIMYIIINYCRSGHFCVKNNWCEKF